LDDVDNGDAGELDEEDVATSAIADTLETGPVAEPVPPATDPAPAPVPPTHEPMPIAAAPAEVPQEPHVVPSPPPDEPRPDNPVDRADPGPEDR
jgi:hypothetical protein